RPLSTTEVDYPAIHAAHTASSLADGAEAAAWRKPPPDASLERGATPERVPLPRLADEDLPRDAIARVIRRRGSSRAFTRDSISAAQLGTALATALGPIPTDLPASVSARMVEPYLIVNAVEGLPSGLYAHHPETVGLETLQLGAMRDLAGTLDLGQDLGA